MERLVPITKIFITLLISAWAIFLKDWHYLLILALVELAFLAFTTILYKQRKAILGLAFFAAVLALIQWLVSGQWESAIVVGGRMLCMTLLFVMLLTTTKLQDLTATLVLQCKMPYTYAFMFTAALRFVPDFIAESRAVQEAQSCRGLSMEGNIFKKCKSYATVIQPLLLKSLSKSENMALSLELRGFGRKGHSFATSVKPGSLDYAIMAILIALTAYLML